MTTIDRRGAIMPVSQDEFPVRKNDLWNPFKEYLGNLNAPRYFCEDTVNEGVINIIPLKGHNGNSAEDSIRCLKAALNKNNLREISKEDYKLLTDLSNDDYYFTVDLEIKGDLIPYPFKSNGQPKEQVVTCLRVTTNKFHYKEIDRDTYYRLKEYITTNEIEW